MYDAFAISYGELGVGTRALGMGGAFTALANDYSALYWNPAGLAAVGKSQFFGELSHQTLNNTATFMNTTTDETWRFTRLRSLGFVLPIPTSQGSAVLAFGYNRQHDMDHNLNFSGFNPYSNSPVFSNYADDDENFPPFDNNLYQTEKVINEGSMKHWSIGGAMALSPNVDVGISLDIHSGSTEYQWDYLQEDINNIFNVYPGDYDAFKLLRTINTDYSAWGFKIGGTFKILPSIKLGMNVGIPTTFTLKEKWSEVDEIYYDNDLSTYGIWEDASGQFEYKIKVPYYFDAGIGYTSELISVGASMRYRDWSQLRFEIAEGDDMTADNSDLLTENNYIRSDLQATINYNIGGEIYLKNLKTKLRAGYAYKPYPVKDADEDLDRKYYTGGIGFILDQYITLDLGVVKTNWTQYSSDDWTVAETKEEINNTKVFLGLTYNF